MRHEERPDDLPPLGAGRASETIRGLPGGERIPALGRAGIAFGLLALLFVVALVAAPWAFIVLGAGVGLLVAAGIPAARAGLRPVGALARAAMPLFLPLFVFVAAGVVKSPAGLQFAVGLATLLAAWFWLIRPDWDRIADILAPRARWRSPARAVAQVVLPALIAAAALAYLASSLVDLLSDSQETARRLFVLAAACLAAAALLRIFGYARTAFRALVSLALLVLLVRLAVDVGLIPGGALLDHVDARALAVVAGGLLVLTSAVEIASALLSRGAGELQLGPGDELPLRIRAAALLETPVAARWLTDRAGLAGLGLALLSSALLLAAVYAASAEGGSEEQASAAPRAGQPSSPPGSMDDATLAETFSPILLFTEDQRWTPIAVDEYVRGATVSDWEGRKSNVTTVGDLETECPGVVQRPCYVLRQACPEEPDEARCAESLADDKAVYVRVARREQWEGCDTAELCADGSPDPFGRARGPYAEDTTILLEYWYFYPYNEWVAPVAIGELEQIHPADWEAVTIGLSREEPLWVAYSAHCGGTFADWSRVRVAESDRDRLRPLVAVANGSQANYRVAEERRVPNFAECSGIARDRLALASYAANIRDRTDDHTTWDPAPEDLRLVTAETPPMSFPGRWATHSRMRLETGYKALPLGGATRGPSSPSLQALWQTPMRTIFGGGPWQEG